MHRPKIKTHKFTALDSKADRWINKWMAYIDGENDIVELASGFNREAAKERAAKVLESMLRSLQKGKKQ